MNIMIEDEILFSDKEMAPREDPIGDCTNLANEADALYGLLDRPSHRCKRVILAMVEFQATYEVLTKLYHEIFNRGNFPVGFEDGRAVDTRELITPLAATFERGVDFIRDYQKYIKQVDINARTHVPFDYRLEEDKENSVVQFEKKVDFLVRKWKARLKSWLYNADMSVSVSETEQLVLRQSKVLQLSVPRIGIPIFTQNLIDSLKASQPLEIRSLDMNRLKYAWHAIRDANEAMNEPGLSLLLQLASKKSCNEFKVPMHPLWSKDDLMRVSESDPFGPFTLRELNDEAIKKIAFKGIRYLHSEWERNDEGYEISGEGKIILRGKLSPEVIIDEKIKLDEPTKRKMKMPSAAHSFRFMYPTLRACDLSAPPADPMEFLKVYGGFAYFGKPSGPGISPEEQQILTVVGMVSSVEFEEKYANHFSESGATVFTDIFLWPSLKIPKEDLGIGKERFQWMSYKALDNPHSFAFTKPGELGIPNFGGFLLDYGPGYKYQICYNIIPWTQGMWLNKVRLSLNSGNKYFNAALFDRLQFALNHILTQEKIKK